MIRIFIVSIHMLSIKKVALPHEEFVEGSSVFLTFDFTQHVEKVNWKGLIKKELNCIKKI